MRRFLVSSVVVAAMFVAAAAVMAVADNGDTFTACLDEKGRLTQVAEGTEPVDICKKDARVVSWSAEGPQGPPGVDGIEGPPGQDAQPCTVVEDLEGTFTMTCPDGSQVQWAGGPTSTTMPPSLVPPIRAAFMYPWFPKAWNQGGQLPFTQFTPSNGLYDSSDPDTIDRQVEQATEAGLEAFIASWWGPDHHTDAALTAIFDQVPQSPNPDFRLAVYYEEEGQSDPSASVIKDDLVYLERFFDRPNYLRIDDKPVVFVWTDANDGADMAARWSDAKELYPEVHVALKVFPGFRDVPDQPDSWHQYGPANNYSEHLPYSAVVSPGFWHANEETPRLVRDPARFRDDVEAMKASGAFWQLIISWNEWGEGTAVEPASEFGTTYLEVLTDVLAPQP